LRRFVATNQHPKNHLANSHFRLSALAFVCYDLRVSGCHVVAVATKRQPTGNQKGRGGQ
jgi:hypothetical protein